ncbi:MAG: pirin family protein [Nitrososphaerales archaeon]
MEGGGFPVRRPFPVRTLSHVDPFLLLDEMGPVEWKPGEAIGAPDHPHRGFEAVTYLLDGQIVHEDSAGHKGQLGPGDVQWMTAGSGVIHSEMPDPHFQEAGGLMHGFQIWVNLPARDKMMKPRYQEVSSQTIPEGKSGDGKASVRVIAGRSKLGGSAVIDTRTPIMYLHYLIQGGGQVEEVIPRDYGSLVYVFKGEARIGTDSTVVRSGQMAILGDGESVQISVENNTSESAEMLILGGVPLKESVARYGPFVMNTEEEIQQAVQDYQNGVFTSNS